MVADPANPEAFPIRIDPVSTSRIWGQILRVAHAQRLSAYDAMYLGLAIRMQLPLATLDCALAAAGRAGLEVPTVAWRCPGATIRRSTCWTAASTFARSGGASA